MRLSIFVFERTGHESRRHLFRAFGVNWLVTSFWPGLIVWTFSVGILGGLFYAPTDDTGRRVVIGVGYGALTLAAVVLHSVGHIVSGHAVGARMHSNLITATVPVNLYHEDDTVTRRVHVARALGGPALNLALGLVSVALGRLASGGGFFAWFAAMNLAIGVMTLLPLPTLDGWVFVRELRGGSGRSAA
jgi:Zn-dependent protease